MGVKKPEWRLNGAFAISLWTQSPNAAFMSANGTKQTSQPVCLMSAFGGLTDMSAATDEVR